VTTKLQVLVDPFKKTQERYLIIADQSSRLLIKIGDRVKTSEIEAFVNRKLFRET
jgi:hypothetical protein